MNRSILSILGGLGGMFGWGASDFLANTGAEKVGHTRTFFWSQIAGLVLVGILFLYVSPAVYLSPLFYLLSAVGGIAYTLGYLLFYKGFEIGNVSVVSSVVNLQAVFVMIMSFFLYDQSVTSTQIGAISILLIGITLVSVNYDSLKKGKISFLSGVKETLLATTMFGIFYWPLNEYLVENADWLTIVLTTKFFAIVTVLLISLFGKADLKPKSPTIKLWGLLAAIGLLEALAVTSVSWGQYAGDGILVLPISSALTIVTVGLAMIFSKEKISRVQSLGIFMAVIGIVLTAV
jgi:bacterial/archaeal transporter family protein